MPERILKKDFFSRDAEIVAKELLGKILVRIENGKKKKAKIVETEAYYGKEDPASRACKNGDLKKTMEDEPGKILVYGVHNNWLINFVTGKKGKAEAVLIRSIEPLNFDSKCCGPGLLTKSLNITKNFHNKTLEKSRLYVLDNLFNGEIIESFRIGVKKDLPRKLRFYIKDNKYISRK
jgi:DNA-3-methyladenine glycosylase